MINLSENKNYYILVDGQGGTFGGGRIFESIEEVGEQFLDWADDDGMLETSEGEVFDTIVGCLETWVMELQKYNGICFKEVDGAELDYQIKIKA